MGIPIIDAHIHMMYFEKQTPGALDWVKSFYGEENFQDFYDKMCDPDHFVAYLRANGVDYGFIFAELCPAVTGICSNESVLEFCAGREALIPIASINPHLTVNLDQELSRLVKAGFRGLKMLPTYQFYYPHETRLYPLYARAQELQIPVLFHTGSSIFHGTRLKYGDPLFFDDIAVDFPDLKIVLVHGGRGFWYDRALFLARLHSNIYLEIAGLPPQNLLQYFPELDKITDKVIFGSDWPGVPSIKKNIEIIKQLPFGAEAIDNILGGNAAKLINLTF